MLCEHGLPYSPGSFLIHFDDRAWDVYRKTKVILGTWNILGVY